MLKVGDKVVLRPGLLHAYFVQGQEYTIRGVVDEYVELSGVWGGCAWAADNFIKRSFDFKAGDSVDFVEIDEAVKANFGNKLYDLEVVEVRDGFVRLKSLCGLDKGHVGGWWPKRFIPTLTRRFSNGITEWVFYPDGKLYKRSIWQESCMTLDELLKMPNVKEIK